jgi:hypothetical protein
MDSEFDAISDLFSEQNSINLIRSSIQFAVDAEPALPSAREWLQRVTFLFDALVRHVERIRRIEELEARLGDDQEERPALRTETDLSPSERDRLCALLDRTRDMLHAAKPNDVAGMEEILDHVRATLRETAHILAEEDLSVE